MKRKEKEEIEQEKPYETTRVFIGKKPKKRGIKLNQKNQ